MPILQIHLMEGRDEAKKAKLVKQVTQAVVDSLGVPSDSVRIILSDMAPHDYAIGGVLIRDQKK